MRISDWSSDVCSSDLLGQAQFARDTRQVVRRRAAPVLGPTLRADQWYEPDRAEILLRIAASARARDLAQRLFARIAHRHHEDAADQIGRASCRERVCQYV